MIHEKQCPLAGKLVKIKSTAKHPQQPDFGGSKIMIEDWWDRVYGASWMDAIGNPAATIYAMRSSAATPPIPMDNNVVYGKIGSFGHLVHISELELE